MIATEYLFFAKRFLKFAVFDDDGTDITERIIKNARELAEEKHIGLVIPSPFSGYALEVDRSYGMPKF
jgi:hypothetical protein